MGLGGGYGASTCRAAVASCAAMGIFDRFRSPAQPLTPEQLRDQLLDAVAARNEALLAELCATHEEAVLACRRSPDSA